MGKFDEKFQKASKMSDVLNQINFLQNPEKEPCQQTNIRSLIAFLPPAHPVSSAALEPDKKISHFINDNLYPKDSTFNRSFAQ